METAAMSGKGGLSHHPTVFGRLLGHHARHRNRRWAKIPIAVDARLVAVFAMVDLRAIGTPLLSPHSTPLVILPCMLLDITSEGEVMERSW